MHRVLTDLSIDRPCYNEGDFDQSKGQQWLTSADCNMMTMMMMVVISTVHCVQVTGSTKLKDDNFHYRLQLKDRLADFNNFWYEYS